MSITFVALRTGTAPTCNSLKPQIGLRNLDLPEMRRVTARRARD
jgi:hypothetical protein